MRVLGSHALQIVLRLAIRALANHDYLVIGGMLLVQEHRKVTLQFRKVVVGSNQYGNGYIRTVFCIRRF